MNLKDVADWTLKLLAHVDKTALKYELCNQEQLYQITNDSAAIAGLVELCGLAAVEEAYGFKITPAADCVSNWNKLSEPGKIQYLITSQLLGYRMLRACDMPELSFQDQGTIKDVVDCWALLYSYSPSSLKTYEDTFMDSLGSYRLSDLLKFARDSSGAGQQTYSSAFFARLLGAIKNVSCDMLEVRVVNPEHKTLN